MKAVDYGDWANAKKDSTLVRQLVKNALQGQVTLRVFSHWWRIQFEPGKKLIAWISISEAVRYWDNHFTECKEEYLDVGIPSGTLVSKQISK